MEFFNLEMPSDLTAGIRVVRKGSYRNNGLEPDAKDTKKSNILFGKIDVKKEIARPW